jgi:hypothetical protein
MVMEEIVELREDSVGEMVPEMVQIEMKEAEDYLNPAVQEIEKMVDHSSIVQIVVGVMEDAGVVMIIDEDKEMKRRAHLKMDNL